jgi:RNA polymerase sigma-70 factor (ECF subfamily)
MNAYDRFEKCYIEDAAAILRYARYRVGVDHAEDVVADTFAVAWQKLDQVPDPAKPWLLATARRVSANHLRARRRERERRGEVDDFLADLSLSGTDLVDHRRDLITAIKVLPPLDREALLLVTWCDLTNTEAAKVMESSVTAFNVRLHRARKRLQRVVRESELEEHTRGDFR